MGLDQYAEFRKEQWLTLNKWIAEAMSKRDEFTTEADVRYFETDAYLHELNSAE